MNWKDEEARKAYYKAYREANREKQKAYDKAYRETNREKSRARKKAWRENNREKIEAYNKAHRENNREKKKAYRENNHEKIAAYMRSPKGNAIKWRSHARHKTDIEYTMEQVQAAEAKRTNVCEICGRDCSGDRRRNPLDHKHTAPYQIRGWLCHRCNTVLGLAENADLTQRIKEYIGRYEIKALLHPEICGKYVGEEEK